MTTLGDDRLAQLRRAYGRVSAPERITQEAFDFDDHHLRRLARLTSGDRAEGRDIWEYTQDLLYTEVQGPLLVYLLPFCLQAWRDDLRGVRSEYGGFVEHFYPVLADRGVFTTHLTARQTAAVSQFMRETILDEIDDQRGLAYQGANARPYRWIAALNTHGVLLPDLHELWEVWWTTETVGRAVAAVQYVSSLMYQETDNPVFAPWTPERGGGPPCLWEFAGHLYKHCWLTPNVEFLTRTLTSPAITEVLGRAVERLHGQPEREKAQEVYADLPLCTETLTSRCSELPRFLAKPREPGNLLEWSS